MIFIEINIINMDNISKEQLELQLNFNIALERTLNNINEIKNVNKEILNQEIKKIDLLNLQIKTQKDFNKTLNETRDTITKINKLI
jgi:hypothetical protein